MVYTRLLASLGGIPGLYASLPYWVVYPGYMPPYHTTLGIPRIYTTLYTPVHTTPLVHPCPRERALGSVLRFSLGGRPLRVSDLQECDRNAELRACARAALPAQE